jgi:hypothetical protein
VAGHGNPNGDFPSVTAFFVEVLRRLRPPNPHVLFVPSPPNENRPRPETVCWKEFNVFLLPRQRTEVAFHCNQKAYASIFISIRSILCAERRDIAYTQAALPHFQETAQLERADAALSHSFQTF